MDGAESPVAPGTHPEPSPEQDAEGRRRIGEIFVELGFITTPQLEAALEVQREKGGRIGEILVAQGSLTRLDLASALTEHWEPQRFAVPKVGRGGASIADPPRGAEDHGAIAELGQRLRAAEERLGSVEGSADPNGGFVVQTRAVAELEERLVRVEHLVGGFAELNLRVATLEQALDQSDDLRPSDVATGARLAGTEATLENRLEGVESRNEVIATLEEAFDALGLRLRALVALRSDVDAARANTDRSMSSLKLEVGSLGARVDELRGLRSADSQELERAAERLSSRLDDLARRLHAHDAAHEEHVTATEQALLEGLSTLRVAIEGLEASSR
jgi:hypothetical protein